MKDIQEKLFYEIFSEICYLNGTSPSAVARELNISMGTVANWKQGGVPQSATIRKIEDRFKIEGGTINGILAGLESPYSHDYYVENWRTLIKAMFPNTKSLPGVDNLAVLTQEDLNRLKEYIQTIRENLIRIETLVYGENKKDRR